MNEHLLEWIAISVQKASTEGREKDADGLVLRVRPLGHRNEHSDLLIYRYLNEVFDLSR